LQSGRRTVSATASIYRYQLAGFAFRVMKLVHHQRHILSSAYKLQPFFRITAFSASLRDGTSGLPHRHQLATSEPKPQSWRCGETGA
jgi:hypothetical protein